MGKWYDIKVRGRVGGGARDSKEVSILNRELRWDHDGLKYSADPKHAKIITQTMGLE